MGGFMHKLVALPRLSGSSKNRLRLQARACTCVLIGMLILASLPAQADAPHKESEDLRRAKRILDHAAAVFESHANSTWEEVRPLLADILKSEPTPYLTDAETKELNHYANKYRQRLAPILQKFNPATHKDPAVFNNEQRCSVHCVLVFLLTCDSNCLVGACLGIIECEKGLTVPDCDECEADADSPCTDDEDCSRAHGGDDRWRCSKWVFKKNECVLSCDDDHDCPAGESCKRPFGTSFKRCK
jgi:hypothetical protein